MASDQILKEPEKQKLEQLRELLFAEQIKLQQEIVDKVHALEEEINVPEKLEPHLEPHFEKHIKFLQANFPNLFRTSLTKALEEQVSGSNDAIINALYPIMGKMITRYIKNELEKLSQRIDEAQQDFFSLHSWKMRAKSFITGIPYHELVMKDNLLIKLEEVFLIDNESGLLLGHHSFNNLMDPDMIAGMLTGIKGFVEHAFQQDAQDLETVEYEKYKIVINTFQNFYIASVVSGTLSQDFKESLDEEVLDFLKSVKLSRQMDVTGALQQEMSEKLKDHFHGFNQLDQ